MIFYIIFLYIKNTSQITEEDKNLIDYINSGSYIKNGILASYHLSNNALPLDKYIARDFSANSLAGFEWVFGNITEVVRYFFNDLKVKKDTGNNSLSLIINGDDMKSDEFLAMTSIFVLQLNIWGDDFIKRIKEDYNQDYIFNADYSTTDNTIIVTMKNIITHKKDNKSQINTINKSNKKGPSPYILYCNDRRKEIKIENPNASFSQIGRLIGEEWQLLSDEEKSYYTNLSAEMKR